METQLLRTEIVNQETDPRLELAKKAESLLGYSHLRKHLKVVGDLAAALQLLEIHPFDMGSVEQYKREKTMEMHNRFIMRTLANPTGLRSDRVFTNFGWQTAPLKDYAQPVPEFVLRKAIQIKELCPDVTLYVDSFIVMQRTDDPFLVAELGHERFYVEVWDEPKFEKEL